MEEGCLNAILAKAWEAQCDESSDKLVLVYLADRANANGKAWPHVPTIVRDTGLGRSTVIESMKRLESRKHVSVSRRRGCANKYTVHPRTSPATGLVGNPATGPLPVQRPDRSSPATGLTTEPSRTIIRTQSKKFKTEVVKL